MKKTKKINVFSFAKLHAIMVGLLVLLWGILYSFGGLFVDLLGYLGWVTSTETSGLGQGTLLGFGALIAMPVLFSITGFLLGIIQDLLFNFFAHRFGGFCLDIKYYNY
jgi:hypothetical protein